MRTKMTMGILFLVCVMSADGQPDLATIEKALLDAFEYSIQTESDHLQAKVIELEALGSDDPARADAITYWIAFAEYKRSILHLRLGNEDQANEVLQRGIKRLSNLADPDSEDLALQGIMTSLAISFQPELAAVLSAKAEELFNKAIGLNPLNLRAYMGIGRGDYYKPEQYGGGFKVESSLKKALALPDKSSEEPGSPSWGKDEAYYFLAKFYQRAGRLNEANLYCNQGLKAFPNHQNLQQLKKEL